MYPKLGNDGLTCTGKFSRHPAKRVFSIPLNCTNGRHGTAIITLDDKSHALGPDSYATIDEHSPIAGTGSFHLADKSMGWFEFGETIIASCGCLEPPISSEQELAVDIGDRVFFGYDKSSFTVNAKATLDRQVAWLTKNRSVNILIAGNADARGSETYDLALGMRRAEAVRNYLVAHGVLATRIDMISYGKDKPVAADEDEASYQENRVAITSVRGFNPQVSP
jgi:peptidoglycan-associated lipoprotein